MTGLLSTWRVAVAWFELVRFDIVCARKGFAGIRSEVASTATSPCHTTAAAEIAATCEAVALATCFYWKSVLCLQRSVVLVRLLRRRGVSAGLVIGYRPLPFMAHAWVEVDGHTVNDSPVYARRFRVLLNI
jgi:hypothetical protein